MYAAVADQIFPIIRQKSVFLIFVAKISILFSIEKDKELQKY